MMGQFLSVFFVRRYILLIGYVSERLHDCDALQHVIFSQPHSVKSLRCTDMEV